MTFLNAKRGRFARLLPSVVALGAVVLALKTTDLVHDAYAQVSGQVAALTHDPVPSNKDFAGGEDDQIASASEADVMNSLSKRRRELDARDVTLNNQANMIAAAEARVDSKISQLKQLQAQINALLVQRDDAQKTQLASLVKTYSTMKAKDAARIFNSLPDDVLVPVAHDMKSDIMALILANMNSDTAKSLTVKLANKLTLPQTTDAIAPVPAPVAPTAAPTPVASIAPPAAEVPAPVAVKAPVHRAAKPKAPGPQASAAPVAPTPAPVASPAAPVPATPAAPETAAAPKG